MKSLLAALLLALAASVAIVAGLRSVTPHADREDPFGREEISRPVVLAWPTFAHGSKQ